MNKKVIPYGRQNITADDIKAVSDTLQSDFLTQGPAIKEFENNFAEYIGAKYAVAVSNGTAALHLCALALNVKEGQKVITSPITFAASANCIRYCGGEVIFADIDPETYLLDIKSVRKLLESSPAGTYHGIIPVDFAGGSNPVENIYVDNFCFDKCPAPSLSCDNHINVSLDSNCCAIITPAMVVEGNYPLNCLKVVLKDKFGNIIPSSPRICGPYIGQTITYELVDTCTKNRCWGTLIVEDKLGPKIECENPDTVFCNNSGYNWTPPKVLDNCGAVSYTHLRAHETVLDLVCRLLLEKNK